MPFKWQVPALLSHPILLPLFFGEIGKPTFKPFGLPLPSSSAISAIPENVAHNPSPVDCQP